MALNRRVVLQVTMPALLVALTMLGTSLLGIRSINHLQADRDNLPSLPEQHLRKSRPLPAHGFMRRSSSEKQSMYDPA